jgi:3-deoxy-D-manno-octulosonic-acid transferase
MRLAYSVLLYLLVPFVLLRLFWRGLKLRAYWQRIPERFGFVPRAPVAVWVHAVSVGETVAALPLIKALVARHGVGNVWVTNMTPTGSQRLLAEFGETVRHSYVPYDLPDAVARFLDRAQPQQVVVMETELWPNLFYGVAARRIPLVVANARLSPRSFAGYSRIRGAIAGVLGNCSVVAAQSEADAGRFRALGAPRVMVMGNIKFELGVPHEKLEEGVALRHDVFGDRPIWIAASTHEGEEEQVLTAHKAVLHRQPDAILILVPRHPQRFDAAARAVERAGFCCLRRTTLATATQSASTAPRVLLGDTMGELFTYFAAADIAFVGGSLVPVGGHNVLEPAAVGLPVLFGPHMFNFVQARSLLLEVGAAREVLGFAALAGAIGELMADPSLRSRMGQAGRAAVEANRGALDRLLTLLSGPQGRGQA